MPTGGYEVTCARGRWWRTRECRTLDLGRHPGRWFGCSRTSRQRSFRVVISSNHKCMTARSVSTFSTVHSRNWETLKDFETPGGRYRGLAYSKLSTAEARTVSVSDLMMVIRSSMSNMSHSAMMLYKEPNGKTATWRKTKMCKESTASKYLDSLMFNCLMVGG